MNPYSRLVRLSVGLSGRLSDEARIRARPCHPDRCHGPLGWTPGRNIIPQPPAELAGAIWLAQVYRTAPNSPAGTLCRPHRIAPAAWRGHPARQPDLHRRQHRPGRPWPAPSGGFVTCAGCLDDASLIYDGQPLTW